MCQWSTYSSVQFSRLSTVALTLTFPETEPQQQSPSPENPLKMKLIKKKEKKVVVAVRQQLTRDLIKIALTLLDSIIIMRRFPPFLKQLL